MSDKNSDNETSENFSKSQRTNTVSGGTSHESRSVRKRSKRRRSPSSSSSSSSSSDSGSSTSSSVSRKHNKSHKRKKRGTKRGHQRDRRRLNKLRQEMCELRKRAPFCDNDCSSRSNLNHLNSEEVVDGNISGELFNDCIEHDFDQNKSEPNFVFEIETKLKEPAVPKTPQNYLNTLNQIQHFESNEWCEVRFAETQKSYNHATGFVELEVNEEVKAYDSLRHLAYSDKAFAALTFCVLKQREALQTALRSLLDWGRGTDINYEGLSEKINEQFLNGEYYKVSSELLQLVCGHRADVIQMRRDGITNFLRDPLTKVAVRKIPPSCNHLFKAEALTSLLEKAGGVRKAFLPLNKQGLNTPASQAGPSKLAHHPSQGQ
ncbi:Uncharacterized protein OBRU01_27053, partial [Operophtera brumata]